MQNLILNYLARKRSHGLCEDKFFGLFIMLELFPESVRAGVVVECLGVEVGELSLESAFFDTDCDSCWLLNTSFCLFEKNHLFTHLNKSEVNGL
jgi:hypothetical protein